ncbi:MAG: GldG family protein, partial [Kiritimatiellaeota bacterium]|nr:GldG family protein [Kiritimatiellota bacterium]
AARVRTLLGMVLAPALAVLTCLLARQFNRRVYFPPDRDTRLSPRLAAALETFPAALEATVFMPSAHPAFLPSARLLRAMLAARQDNPNPFTFTLVDPVRDLTAAARLFQAGAPENSLILKTPAARVVLPADDLFEDPAPGARGRLFIGDRAMADALRSLDRPDEQPLYWLTGHGEGAPDDYTPTGFSDIARELRRNGFPSQTLNLLATPAIPADAAALVIAAPRRAFAPEELALVADHLEKGGRLLFFAGETPVPENEDFLARWGLRLTPWHAAGSRTLNGEELIVSAYPPHPATQSLAGSATLFAAPRVVQAAEPGQTQAAVLPVAQTDASGWGALNPAGARAYNSQTDLAGPVAFIMAAEHGGQAEPGLGLGNTRVVVAGGPLFVSNLFLRRRATANIELCVNLVAWLAGAPVIASAETPANSPLDLNLDHRGWILLALFTAGGIPGIPLFLLAVRRGRGR